MEAVYETAAGGDVLLELGQVRGRDAGLAGHVVDVDPNERDAGGGFHALGRLERQFDEGAELLQTSHASADEVAGPKQVKVITEQLARESEAVATGRNFTPLVRLPKTPTLLKYYSSAVSSAFRTLKRGIG
jgi:hypothetical protein